MLIASFAILLLLAGYYSWTSSLNQFFFFGRTVPEDFPSSAAARSIVRRYLLEIWLGSVPAALVGVLLWQRHYRSCLLWPIVVETLAFYFAFSRAHRKVGQVAPVAAPHAVVEVPLKAREGGVPSLAALLMPMVIAVTVLCVSLVAAARGGSLKSAPAALDALVAVHGGEPLFSFGLGLVTAGFLAVLIRLRARTRTPLAENALRSSMLATWAGVVTMTSAIVVAFAGGEIAHVESKMVVFVAVFAALAVIVFRSIHSRRFAPPAAEMLADENWRWGLFYCNRSDPALFVQCRCGTGYTLNYGRASAWPLLAVLVSFLLIALVAVGHQ